jgi:hypothetical protein
MRMIEPYKNNVSGHIRNRSPCPINDREMWASSQMQTSLERLNTEACPRLKQQKHAGRTAPPASMECDGKALEELDQKDLVEFVDL